MGSSFDPAMIRDDQWVFHKFSEDGLWKISRYTDPALGITIQKKEPTFESQLVEQNRNLLNDSAHKRWGDGKVVARVPLNVFYKDFKGRHNDPEFTEWWTNNSENRLWRTFKGNV